MSRLLLFVCAVTLIACATQPVTNRVLNASSEFERAKHFQSEVENIREEYALPGMTAAYVMSDGSSVSAASGLADVEAKVAMRDKPRMLAASIGKSFVGALTIALALEGRLSLDEPVSHWLGKYEWFARLPNHSSITLHHLLTHSAGLPDHVHMEVFQKAFVSEWQAKENPFQPTRLVEFILDKPALFPAGQGWSYSDTGYILVGMVIEEVTGNVYYDEVRDRFFNPLRLVDTSPSNRRDLERLASGYTSPDNPFGLPARMLDEKGLLVFHPGLEWTGGGLVTTSNDLAHWGAALFSGKALTGDYLSQLFKSVPIDPKLEDIEYGAGISIVKTGPAGPVYGHAGWIPGYISSLRHYSDKGVTIAFQINTDTGIIASEEGVAQKIEQRLLQVVVNNKVR
ncbi:MAG: beta-lactamase family protein [Gammaproteobacteria bacterium]|nr:beta-lactamase family protein [Gammaproteobacteria bacterium]